MPSLSVLESSSSLFQRTLERVDDVLASPGKILTSALTLFSTFNPAQAPLSTDYDQGAVDFRGGVIQHDHHFFGQSPPVYPSPQIDGRGDWHEASIKAREFVDKLTLEEKISLTTGGARTHTGCSGFIPSVERLDFPGLCVTDAGDGVRGTELVSAWPGGISVAASWNKELAHARAVGMGGEYKRKGVNVMLGPVVGPIGRVVTGGRIWEGFGVDPYLAGQLVYETIVGTQSAGIGTSTKHFIANEQENNRNPEGDVAAVSANIDDKTMHELYLWPFADAVRAGSTNIMCSYQRLNNSYGCQNSKTLNGLLKTELGFQGFVMSDWGAIHGGVASAEAGLDMAMPDDSGYWGNNLVEAVHNGTMSEGRIDDMVARIMAAYYYLEQEKTFTDPGFGMPADLKAPHTAVEARDPKDKPTLYQGAVESHVLVKNEGNVLPLDKPKILSVFGFSARSADDNSLTEAWLVGTAPYEQRGQPHPGRSIAINGTLITGGGSGASPLGLFSSPMDALNAQAWEDDTYLYWDFTTDEPLVNGASDACMVFVNQFSTEGFDRPALQSEYSNRLIKNVADKCNDTIVVIHNVATALVDPEWFDHPSVKVVMYAHLPGQYSGKALVDLLYGRENFSGKLPYTVAKHEKDYGHLLRADKGQGKYEKFPQSDFKEGSLIDYRRFDDLKIEPRFHFGFGLSYTTFGYSDLKLHFSPKKGLGSPGEYAEGEVLPGGKVDLWDVLVNVEVKVENTGRVDGAEAAQLYLSIPGAGKHGQPIKTLRGFEKHVIKVGEEETFKFNLTRRDLSTWDVVAQEWKLQKGQYKVMVGRNSGDLPLHATFEI